MVPEVFDNHFHWESRCFTYKKKRKKKKLWRRIHDLSEVKFLKASVLILPLEKLISYKISWYSDRVDTLSANFEFWDDLEFIRHDSKT